MLASHEKRLLLLLAAWLAAGAALDVLAHLRPRPIVQLVGEGRFADLLRAGESDLSGTDRPGHETAAPGGGGPDARDSLAPRPGAARVPRGAATRRGRPFAYDGLGRLDLNAADSTELELLPGIGPALASRILAERRRRGGFRDCEDLLRVRGIGPRTLASLRSHVVVGGAGDSLPGARGPQRAGTQESTQIAR